MIYSARWAEPSKSSSTTRSACCRSTFRTSTAPSRCRGTSSGTARGRTAFIVYTNLGDLYLEQERFQDAADAYHAFVKLDPYHAKAPLLQVEVIEAFKKGGFADLVLASKENFVDDLRSRQPVLAAVHVRAAARGGRAPQEQRDGSRGSYHHSQAQQTHDAAEYTAAARWYRTYLQSFPDGSERCARRTSCSPRCCSRAATTTTQPSSTSGPRTRIRSTRTAARRAMPRCSRTRRRKSGSKGAAKASGIRSRNRERATVRRLVSDARERRDRADRRGREALRARRLRAVSRRCAGRGRAHAAGRADAAAHGVDGSRALRVRSAGLRRRREARTSI